MWRRRLALLLGLAAGALLLAALQPPAPPAPRPVRPTPVPPHGPGPASRPASAPTATAGDGAHYPVPRPPFSAGIFPCSQCHEGMETNPKRRVLKDEHTNIVLKHDAEHRWCLDCHNPSDRDKLRLASGALVSFDESYRLCGQCHGDKYRDWRAGVHGRRTGRWNGRKSYLLCVHCHNPHQPRFKPLAPMPPPVRPEQLRHEQTAGRTR